MLDSDSRVDLSPQQALPLVGWNSNFTPRREAWAACVARAADRGDVAAPRGVY
jgi:hypothetical protein